MKNADSQSYEQSCEQVMNSQTDLKRHSPLIPPIEKERERERERNRDKLKYTDPDPDPCGRAHAREGTSTEGTGTGTGTGAGTGSGSPTGSGSVDLRHCSGSGSAQKPARRMILVDRNLILYGKTQDGRIIEPVRTALLVLGVPVISEVNGVRYNNASIWRGILKIIGERAFRDVLYQQWDENRTDGNPRSRAATFQAKLNRLKYGTGGAA